MDALGSLGDIFEKFGGHPQACGFTLKRGMTDELRARLIAHAAEVFGERELVPELSIDAEIALEAVDWNFCETVKTFEPFGVGNLEPKFLARDLRVEEIFSVGADAKHLRLTVSHWSGERRKMIAFGFGPGGNGRTRELEPGAKIDAVFNVGVNEWNGNREIQLKVVDFRTAEEKL
jgi:single-stranded-DNA-specific exonuclease